jgi:drug/metabolite transporter (DMT)-like permease
VGEAAALGSAAFWALSAVLIKGVSGRRSAFYIMAVRTSFATLLALAIFLAIRPSLSGFDLQITLALLVSAALAMLADSSFVRAMAVEDVSRVFIISTSLYILMSVAGSILVSGEPFSGLLIIAGLAVLSGSWLVLHRPRGPAAPVAAPSGERNARFALLLAVVAALLWSTSLLVVSEAMESIDTLAATAIRLPFMALILGGIVAVRGELRAGLNWQDLRPLAASGALVVGAMTLFLLSAKLSNAGTVAVLTSTSPVFVAPLAHFFLNERLTLRIASGTLTCMLGIWLANV